MIWKISSLKFYQSKFVNLTQNLLSSLHGIDPRILAPIELFSHLDTLLGKLDSEKVELFLIGDMNCDLLSKEKALLNVIDIYGLKQLINEPTRITPLTSTLIDLIFTDQPNNVNCSGVSHMAWFPLVR